MTSSPKSMGSWSSIGRKIGWALLRFQVLGIVVGAIVAILTQFLTGFWEFRNTHEEQLRLQWQAVVSAQEDFETELSRIDFVLSGQPLETAGRDYASAAQTYIRSMEAVSRSLPETQEEIADYIDAIASLRKYYDVSNPPVPRTDEWMVFYGQYRQDLAR